MVLVHVTAALCQHNDLVSVFLCLFLFPYINISSLPPPPSFLPSSSLPLFLYYLLSTCTSLLPSSLPSFLLFQINLDRQLSNLAGRALDIVRCLVTAAKRNRTDSFRELQGLLSTLQGMATPTGLPLEHFRMLLLISPHCVQWQEEKWVLQGTGRS